MTAAPRKRTKGFCRPGEPISSIFYVDRPAESMAQPVPMKYLSTEEVARKAGIGRRTLERWLTRGEIKAPRATQVGEGSFRHWTDTDVERVRRHKQKNYRKGRKRRDPK